MKLALYSHKSPLLERWTNALKWHECHSINWSQVAKLDEMEPLLVHWESMSIEEQEQLKGIALERPVIALTDTPDTDEGRRLILTGVRGYANAFIHPTLLPEVVEEVRKGNVWAVPEILQAILKSFLQSKPGQTAINYDCSQLSEREFEVYEMLMTGASNKEIARSLEITERTVKAHVAAILRKTGAPDRVHLIVHGVT